MAGMKAAASMRKSSLDSPATPSSCCVATMIVTCFMLFTMQGLTSMT